MTPLPRDAREPRAARADGPDQPVDAPSVRPYLVTGGRTRPSGDDLPIEALVECLVPTASVAGAVVRGQTAGPESRRILELTTGRYLSVAEVSAYAQLPVGVVRVLVADLAEAGSVRLHGLGAAALSDPADPRSGAAALAVLESVLDGISAL